MNKKIEFDNNGKHFLLEYDRKTLAQMEEMGFNVNEMQNKPASMLPLAFRGLFLKNHRGISIQEIDDIYKKLPNKAKLTETISAMLLETYQSLQEEPGEEEGNIEWKVL